MKTSSKKNKGRLFQQWVRDLILKTFPILLPEDVRSTSMGASGEDVLLSPRARDLFPYQLECKSHKSFAVYKIIEQAKAHGKHEPLVFLKANNKKPIVIVDAEHFMELVGYAGI